MRASTLKGLTADNPHPERRFDEAAEQDPHASRRMVVRELTESEDWGTPEQVAALRLRLDNLLTCRRARANGALLQRVAQQVQRYADYGASDTLVCTAVRSLCEGAWRRPVISDYVLCRLFQRNLFAAHKVLDLLRWDRTPYDVSEGFVRAVGDACGQKLLARDVFWQRFRPLLPAQSGLHPSGKTFLIAPGVGETGRNFYEQIAQFNRLGHEVVVMDQQWAGQTRNLDGSPTPGDLDSGYGVARDVARVAEYVHRQMLGQGELVLLGQGSGAAAILMLLVAQAAGTLETTLPHNLDAVLQAPYLASTPSSINKVLGFLGRLPMGGSLPAGALFPKPTSDSAAAAKFMQCRRRDNVQVRLGMMTALREDVATTWDLLASGHKPGGKLAVLHSADDPWADPAASHRLSHEDVLGRKAAVRILSGAHHALAHVASERQEALWGLQKLGIELPRRRVSPGDSVVH